MATGTVPTDGAMGRVFCEQMSNGSEYIVWTADSGNFLGYATGAASHEQVYLWWYYVHHQIIFPGDTGMSRTMPMASSARPLNVKPWVSVALATSFVPAGRPGLAGQRPGGRR